MSVDLPLPLTPVTNINLPSGNLTVTFFRLAEKVEEAKNYVAEHGCDEQYCFLIDMRPQYHFTVCVFLQILMQWI